MKNPKELIGKKFKRNKYGPSLWTDEIEKVKRVPSFEESPSKKTYYIFIKGKLSHLFYDLEECIIIN